MTCYVALLRGINVGGVTITMADLSATVTGLGHTGVRTVLASGNVLFESDQTDAGTIKSGLERALTDRFGYAAWVVLVTRDELAAAVERFPFEDRDGWHSYILFGSDPATLDDLVRSAPPLDPADESIRPGEGVLYWQVRRAVGVKSPFSVLAAKARFKSSTTTRNLRTLHKILGVPTGR